MTIQCEGYSRMCVAVWGLLVLASTMPSGGADRLPFAPRLDALIDEVGEAGHPVIEGRDGWLFLPADVRHLAHRRFWGEDAPADRDPTPAILDFHAQLKARGIELLLVPVPAKAAVRIDDLIDGNAFDNPHQLHDTFYARLRQAGVAVLDPYPDFEDRRQAGDDVYCRQDTHWTPAACAATAGHLAEWIRAHPVGNDLTGDGTFERRTAETITLRGDLWRMLGDEARPLESLPIERIEGETVDRASPILLLGDSHVLVFHAGGDMHASQAGLADHLAAAIGRPVDLLGVRGSGATPARINLFRRTQSDPAYLSGKRLVIWCFTAREFTQHAQWRKVPVSR